MTTTQNIPTETDRLFLLAIEFGDRAAKAHEAGRFTAEQSWTDASEKALEAACDYQP